MSAKHEGLNGQQQRLDLKKHGVHESNCIDQVEAGTPEEADILRGQEFVVAGVGVCNATTARCHALEPPFVKGFEKGQDCPRARHRLGLEQLLAAAELTCGDVSPAPQRPSE